MDLKSSNLPEITPVLIVLWGLCIFVIGYFYRHAPKKNRVGFMATLAAISTLFFFIWLYFWYHNRPPFTPIRIAVFPYIAQTDESNSISWESIALSEISTNYLNQGNPEELLPYETDWIFAAANKDSLTLPSYVLDFSKRIGLDYAVLGRFIKKLAQFEIDFQIYKIENMESLFSEKTILKQGELREFCNHVSTTTLHKVLGIRGDVNFKNSWNSKDQLTKYFKSKFYYLTDKPDLALRFAEAAVKEDSTSTECLNFLAELYINKGFQKKSKGDSPLYDYKLAKTVLLKALSLEENQSNSLCLLAELYLMNEKWNQAELYLRDALDANPLDPRIYFDLTKLHPTRYKKLGFRNDKELLKRAIFINPGFFEARLTLADYFLLKNRHDLALRAAKNVLYINPESVDGLMALSKYYMAQNDMLNLMQTVEKVIKLEPYNAEAYYNLGIVYYHQKDYDTAIKFFERAIQLGNHLDSHLYLAYIYELQDEMDKAIEHLRTRIRKRRNKEDRYAEEARKHLFQIMSQRGAIDSIMSK
ncbi:MAG: tetratricopeptide repeat protein [bacterium]